MKRFTSLVLAVALFLFAFPLSPAGAETARRIRVGFPQQSGFSITGEDGRHSGYTYDYLQEIAQYTGWDYEFVEVPGTLDEALSQMLVMLKNGELDLLGGMALNDSTRASYDFPGFGYGTAYSTLAVLNTNTSLTESNYSSYGTLRVAVLGEPTKRIASMQQFCAANNVKTELVFCPAEEDVMETLRAGKADAFLGSDVSLYPGLRSIAKFSPAPYYLATTKGNSEIVSKLDYAILRINEADPYFQARLYTKYFEPDATSVLLSDAEKDYIKRTDTLRVAVVPHNSPFQYFDAATGEFSGIAKGVFDGIAEKTGLRFEFLPADSMAQVKEMLKNGSVDAVAGIPYDYETAKEFKVAMSRAYVTTQMSMVINSSVNRNNLSGKRLALTTGFPAPEDDNLANAVYYDSAEECLRAINNGNADYGYINAYSVEYYIRSLGLKNIQLVPQSNNQFQICIGIAKPVDTNLLTLLNKGIRSISNEELQSILFQNAGQKTGPITLMNLIDENPRMVIFIVLLICLLAVAFVFWMLRTRLKAARRAQLDNRRYLLLAELSNEFIFEYDYKNDKLTLSDKCARAFGCEPVLHSYRQKLKENKLWDGEGKMLFLRFLDEHDQKEALYEILCPVSGQNSHWYRIASTLLVNTDGKPLYVIGKLTDIQKEKEEKDALLERAQSDGLTGVYNSSTCRELISNLLLQDSTRGAMLIIDLDHFKEVNDMHGHYVGDTVLRELAGVLKSLFRQDDIIGRLGGDEFVVYMQNLSSGGDLAEKCRSLCQAVRGRVHGGNAGLSITVSVGASESDGVQGFKELYQKVDEALYQAKENGRDGFSLAG